jgi:hypothetical protein
MLCLLAAPAGAQVQVRLNFQRLQYIAHEPVMATVTITNLAGREVELHDDNGQPWHGFEITRDDGRLVAPFARLPEPPLRIAAGTAVTRKIDLEKLFPVADLGVYHVRANVYFADLNKFFYAQAKVFEVTTARPIWQQTVGLPSGDGERTYSLMTNRFADHTALYVRVEDKANGLVYSTFSLGRLLSYDAPHEEFDRDNQLHVLHPTSPRLWSYAVVGLDGKLLQHSRYAEVRGTPHLRRTADGAVQVAGGQLQPPTAPAAVANSVPKLSDRPTNLPPGE